MRQLLVFALSRVKQLKVTEADDGVDGLKKLAGNKFDIILTDIGRPAGRSALETVSSGPLVISNASGLHARPAAVLASRAKQFNAEVRMRRGGA